jgi:hypothetical protein
VGTVAPWGGGALNNTIKISLMAETTLPYLIHYPKGEGSWLLSILILIFIFFILVFAIPECCKINNNIKLLTV